MHFGGDISERYSVSLTVSAVSCLRHIVAEPAARFIAGVAVSTLANSQ